MPTPVTGNIPVGSALARKVYSAALFHVAVRKGVMTKLLSGPIPKEAESVRKAEKSQTSADYPIVTVKDLSKQAGDQVQVDVFNIINGKPIMGDKKITGRLMALSFSSDTARINQIRGGVEIPGVMSRQRVPHNLRNIAKANLANWYGRLDDQQIQVHLSGARGFDTSSEWVVPLESDADFSEIMINPVLPPTRNRHFYAGNATSPDTIDAADILTLDTIDKVRAHLDELSFPMQPIKLPEDPGAEDNPLYLLLVTTRQWYHLSTQTGPTAWRTFLQNARERGAKNPLFTGECGMWNGVLIKKIGRPIRFNATNAVRYYDAAGVIQTANVAAGVTVDRALLLGAQALANVYGRHQNSDFYFDWFERKVAEDHDATMEVSVAAMNGKAKLRFNTDGVDTDHGVLVIDSAAADPNA